MKNHIIIFIFLAFSKVSFGQASDTLALNLSQNYCGEAFFNMTYLFNTQDSILFHIDFGNNTDTIIISESSSGINYPYNDFSSTYVYSGNYTVEITAETSGGTFLDHKMYNLAIIGGEGCSQEPIFKIRNNFSGGWFDFITDPIPMDFIGNDGITHTISPTDSTTPYLTNSLLYPAQMTANPAWMTAHNMVQLNPPIHFSAPTVPLLEDMYFGLGYPSIIVSRTDVANVNNSMQLDVYSTSVDDQNPNTCYLKLNNTLDAIPDSIRRIRVEYDPFLQVNHQTLLNITQGTGFIEFDVEKLNLYQSIPFGLTASSVVSLDSIYFRCYYLNNTDQNAQDDTTSLFFESVDPCEGMTDSILNISSSSTLTQSGSAVASYLTLAKNMCEEVDSIEVTIHHSPLLEFDNANASFQFTPVNDSTLHGYVTISQYNSSQYFAVPFTLDAIPPGYIFVNYSIDFQDFDLVDNFTGDTISFTSCDSVDFSLSSLSAVMIAPLEAGSCNISPLIMAPCALADSGELRITFPGYVTLDSTTLLLGTFTDSTLYILVDWSNQNEYFSINFHIPGTIPSGTPYTISAKIVSSYDTDTTNNEVSYQGNVLNSYDPNEKHADLPADLNPNLQEKITYTIHFQNDGNLEAYNIEVRDTLSTNLDISTFQFLGASHPCEVNMDITTREVVFSFPNIMLPSSESDTLGSQGIFSYQILENNNLPLGSVIENTAYIYFDFNPAIVTNTTYHTNQAPLGTDKITNERIYLYPNPAEEKIKFSGGSVHEISIYDLAGKLVLNTNAVFDNEVSLNNLQTGIYQVVLRTNNGISNQKLVIKK